MNEKADKTLAIDAYKKSYKVRAVGPGAYEVFIPKVVVEREAARRGLTPDEFIKQYQVTAYYDAFDGIFYRFEPLPGILPIPKQILEG